MDPDAVPSDLAAALRAAGYRVAGPVGVGSHGPAWAAVGLPDGPAPGTRVVVTELAIPPGAAGVRWRERLDVLAALDHDHLAEIVDVVALDESNPGTVVLGSDRELRRCAVLLAEVPGVNLATLLAARAPLSDGESVTLLVPLAQALATLHAAGLVHGDVSPANVVVRPDGRPVLVDLLGAVTAQAGSRDRRGSRGTPGFAAPETERGDRPGPPADVHAVARTVLAALAGGGASELREVLEGACSPDPAARPSANELAAWCYAAVAPEPLSVPDAAVLARTTLAQLASEPSPRSAMTVRPSRSRHRESRRRWRAAAAGLVVVVTLVAGGVVVASMRSPSAGKVRAAAAAGSPGLADPVAAAVVLTERRAVLLAAGDPAALAEVEVVGEAAQVADLALLAGLDEAGVRIQGLAADVVSARLVDAGAGAPASRARVEITSALTAHRRLTADGTVSTEMPAQPARSVVLTLAWTSAGWRVADVAGAVAVAVSDPGGAPTAS